MLNYPYYCLEQPASKQSPKEAPRNAVSNPQAQRAPGCLCRHTNKQRTQKPAVLCTQHIAPAGEGRIKKANDVKQPEKLQKQNTHAHDTTRDTCARPHHPAALWPFCAPHSHQLLFAQCPAARTVRPVQSVQPQVLQPPGCFHQKVTLLHAFGSYSHSYFDILRFCSSQLSSSPS
jgi:hypothetical protein